MGHNKHINSSLNLQYEILPSHTVDARAFASRMNIRRFTIHTQVNSRHYIRTSSADLHKHMRVQLALADGGGGGDARWKFMRKHPWPPIGSYN